MANVNKIQVDANIYDIEDTTARTGVSNNAEDITALKGRATNLETDVGTLETDILAEDQDANKKYKVKLVNKDGKPRLEFTEETEE